MQLEFVPRKKIADYLSKGWSIVPGYSPPYRGWAVLMQREGE